LLVVSGKPPTRAPTPSRVPCSSAVSRVPSAEKRRVVPGNPIGFPSTLRFSAPRKPHADRCRQGHHGFHRDAPVCIRLLFGGQWKSVALRATDTFFFGYRETGPTCTEIPHRHSIETTLIQRRESPTQTDADRGTTIFIVTPLSASVCSSGDSGSRSLYEPPTPFSSATARPVRRVPRYSPWLCGLLARGTHPPIGLHFIY
jgi:hypothetical protein